MIEKVILSSRVTEIDALSLRMNKAYKNSGLNTDPHLQTMFGQLQNLSGSLTTAINRSKAGSNLEVMDEKRDEQVRSLSYLIQGYLHHPDPAIKEAALAVKSVFDKYGVSITGENYATESSLVTSLLEDLSDDGLQDAIEQLSGCAETISALQSTQNEFETARLTYESEKAEESTISNATAIKKEVVSLINNKIVVYLRAMEIVNESMFGSFVRTVAEIIGSNNEVVKKRRKKESEEETN